MKIKVVFILKNILAITIRRQLQGKKIKNLKKKFQEIAVKRYVLPSSFYPFEVVFLKFAK